MEFNYSFGKNSPGAPSPELDVPYSYKAPRIQANGNLKFLEYIDLIEHLWKKNAPEIIFQPLGSKKVFNPERGYITYELDSRVPKESNIKPRLQEKYDHPDNSNLKIAVYSQSFDNYVNFTAFHSNPRTAEEIIESFEQFMFEVTPVFKGAGLEEFIYSRRLPDNWEKRFGTDIASRTLVYMVTTQKIITIDQRKLQEIVGELIPIIYTGGD